jgi:hypothetical protein
MFTGKKRFLLSKYLGMIVEGMITDKLAFRGTLWYNTHINIVLPERCYQHPQAWTNLLRRLIMDSLTPHAFFQQALPFEFTPEKRCKKCGGVFPATPDFFNRNKGTKDGLISTCKTCSRKCNAQYNEEHREEKNAKARAHYQANRERIQATFIRPYNQSHKEEIRAYKKQWALDHKEERHIYAQQYYQTHKEHIIARVTAYIQGHREKHRLWRTRYSQTPKGREVSRVVRSNRIARQRSVLGNYTPEQIQLLLKAQKYRCYYEACGHAKFEKKDGRYVYHVDHTYPLSRVAGTDIPANDISYLVLACPSCNKKKHAKFPWEWFEGGRLL